MSLAPFIIRDSSVRSGIGGGQPSLISWARDIKFTSDEAFRCFALEEEVAGSSSMKASSVLVGMGGGMLSSSSSS